jgi:O-antigen ligase
MKAIGQDRTPGALIYVFTPLITLLVFTGATLDPVNLPKLVLLSIAAFSCVPIVLAKSSFLWREFRLLVILIGLFILWAVISSVQSKAPFTQSVYGVDGRYTGLLAYICFSILLIANVVVGRATLYLKILYSLLVAGVVNIFYCGFVILSGKDPIPWVNTYGNILGTLGNPNFISSFLGIFVVIAFALIIETKTSRMLRISLISFSGVAILEIINSKSLQGLIVVGVGVAVVLLLYLFWSSTLHRAWIPYLLVITALGITAILGMLQKGPLASVLYKQSVSIRGAYWRAGWTMMQENPVFGIGLGSFGDWYPRARDASALVIPGSGVYTNAAHNVALDIGAGGGVILFSLYLAIHFMVIISAIKFIKRSKSYDAIFVGLLGGWICYTAQSIISINQIGLAVWGWVFAGAVIGYEYSSKDVFENSEGARKQVPKKGSGKVNDYFGILISLAAVVGLLVSLPPFKAEAEWRTASESGDLKRFTSAIETWPRSSLRYGTAIKVLYENKLNSEALKYTRNAIKFYPDSTRLWYFLYQIPESTQQEKDLARVQIRRLDPSLVLP